MNRNLSRQNNQEWKSLAYVVGLIGGLVIGLLSAHLYTQAVEENQDGERPKVGVGEVFMLGTAALALIRQVTDLGARNSSSSRR